MKYNSERALELLRAGCDNTEASFREGQEEAIRHVVEGRGRLLVVQKTGWGKSFVYFIASKLLRESGAGPAIIVSPLLSLMRNQIAAAERMGVRAETIHSDNMKDWEAVEAKVRKDEVDVLLISPERFANEHFIEHVLAEVADRTSLLVVDEAHCISDWGHDFRPHYRRLERIVRNLPQNLRLLATTATANNRVMRDLQEVLGPNLAVSRGDLNRPSLTLQTIRLPNQAERLAWLAEHVPHLEGSGIVYTLTVRDADLVASWLKHRGIPVAAYTGKSGAERPELEQALLNNEVKALVATTALGMGFDKPDLAFVIHFQTPGSVVAYYQQVGRAGRGIPAAYGVLLSGIEETDITDWFIEAAFPSRDQVEAVLGALKTHSDGLSSTGLLGVVNMSKGRVDKTLELLALESPAPIVKMDGKWQLTAEELSDDFWARAERLTELRRQEQEEMQKYVGLSSGHMEFLLDALDADTTKVEGPTLPPLPTTPDPGLLNEAVAFLRRSHLSIEPRKQWPPGGMPIYDVRGKIPENERAQEGKALCVWEDAGWGQLVEAGKYSHRRFDDELVSACVTMLREWSPEPAPTWVACVPSADGGDAVRDFAERLAGALKLPFHAVLVKTENRPEQKTMANSTQQARNVDGSLAVQGEVPEGPVLLVDDVVNSRWTLTVSAYLLRTHGSGEVWPLALATTGRTS